MEKFHRFAVADLMGTGLMQARGGATIAACIGSKNRIILHLMNTIGYFEIQSSDPQRDIKFYEAVFGWKFIPQEGLPVEYYRIETGSNVNGGLLKRPMAPPPPQHGTNAFVCSIEVAEFDATGARVLEAGGRVAMAKFEIPGRCWQGYFLDADGNTFGVFEAV